MTLKLRNHYRFMVIFVIVIFLSEGSVSAETKVGVVSLCRSNERVQFSCTYGTSGSKTQVSLCAAPINGPAQSLTYRQGNKDQIEDYYIADGNQNRRFSATIMPLSPGAVVTQIWFNRDDKRYWMGLCTGGNCPQEAVVGVLKENKVIRRAVCDYDPSNLTFFKNDVLHFSNSGDDLGTANSRLIDLDYYDLPIGDFFVKKNQQPK